ncbi:MAG TPA: glycosyltransferase family 4 protein [Candidatus Nitrosotalea sp.]|nr:glycosyltransferase family 4 protein [Candidatus Nitrosotalea sp.]
MKIALCCPASLPATQFGGILFLSVDIATELGKIGHDVTIYTTDLDHANNAKTFNKNLLRLERFSEFKINRTHTWFSLHLFFVNPGMYFEMRKDIPDVIHTIGVRSFQSFIAALIAKRYKVPLVISDQGGLSTHPDLKESGVVKRIFYRMQSPLIKFIVNNATKIIAANEYEKKIFSHFNVDSKIEIVRNGIHLSELEHNIVDFKKKYNISNRYILFVGRFSKVKGVDLLVRAFAQIKDNPSVHDIKLVIMGVDFGYESQMRRLIEELGISEKVLVIAKPPREDVIAAYQACEFLVLPSRWELSPLTPLEGFAFQKAVISTNTHGIPHTISDGENCILVEPENYPQISDAILRLLNNDKMRMDLGMSGYRLVHNVCNSKIMADNVFKIYQRITDS